MYIILRRKKCLLFLPIFGPQNPPIFRFTGLAGLDLACSNLLIVMSGFVLSERDESLCSAGCLIDRCDLYSCCRWYVCVQATRGSGNIRCKDAVVLAPSPYSIPATLTILFSLIATQLRPKLHVLQFVVYLICKNNRQKIESLTANPQQICKNRSPMMERWHSACCTTC